MLFATGAIENPPDYRDISIGDVFPVPLTLPDEYFVDVSNLPIWYQKSLGSCGGHAVGKYAQKKNEIETKEVKNLSARFAYALAKCFDGFESDGTNSRSLFMGLKNYGIATEDTCENNCNLEHEEYVYNRKLENIPKEALEEAKKYKIKSFAYAGLSLDEIKHAIMVGDGALMLVRVGNPWWTSIDGLVTWVASKILPLRPPKKVTGGHFVYAYGFKKQEDGKTQIHSINSWSENWANKGKGYFLYEDYAPYINEVGTMVDLPNEVLEEVKILPPPQKWRHLFVGTLKYGQTNDEIKALQIALKLDGLFPVGQKETGFYGPKTQEAVKKFQAKYSVASWLELKLVNGKTAGPKTIKKLNEIYHK